MKNEIFVLFNLILGYEYLDIFAQDLQVRAKLVAETGASSRV